MLNLVPTLSAYNVFLAGLFRICYRFLLRVIRELPVIVTIAIRVCRLGHRLRLVFRLLNAT